MPTSSLSLSEPHALILFSHDGGVSSVNAFTGAVAAVQFSGTVDAFDYHYTEKVRVQCMLLENSSYVLAKEIIWQGLYKCIYLFASELAYMCVE